MATKTTHNRETQKNHFISCHFACQLPCVCFIHFIYYEVKWFLVMKKYVINKMILDQPEKFVNGIKEDNG